MKRLLAALAALLVIGTVPTFAADTRYVPQLPPFYSGGKITAYYNTEATAQVKSFFADFKDRPHVTLITQDSKNGFYQNKDYGDDRLWKLVFVKLPASVTPGSFGSFVYYDPLKYADRAPKPMDLSWNGHDYFEMVVYSYDFNTKRLQYHYFSKTNKVQFSYLIDSSPLSNSAPFYPGYRTLARKYDFFTDSANVSDTLKKHYNWWLGATGGSNLEPPEPDINIDTNGDGKPDLNVDTDGDGNPDINIDTNGDKRPDLNVDTNGDGKPDINVDTNGDGKPDINIDTNGDKKPDLNIDTNGDKRPDLNVDTNGDGKPDINIDTNGDGKPDINIDTNGDGRPDINIDTNGDKKPDINVDTNGDGTPDVDIDTNGDGKPDKNPSGGGSSSGGSSDGSSSDSSSSGGSSGGGIGGGGHWWDDPDWGKDWFPSEDSSEDVTYRDFPIFDPFSYGEYKPPYYDDPWNDYDPLEGYEIPNKMPNIPTEPNFGDYQFHNPFARPPGI